jgi:hypothetical protein
MFFDFISKNGFLCLFPPTWHAEKIWVTFGTEHEVWKGFLQKHINAMAIRPILLKLESRNPIQAIAEDLPLLPLLSTKPAHSDPTQHSAQG